MKTAMRYLNLAAFFPLLVSSVFAATGSADSSGFDALIQQGRAALLAADPARAESAYSQACPAGLVSTYPVAWAVECENALASVDEVRGNLARAEQRYVHAAAAAEQAGPAYLPLYCARLIDLGEHYHRQRRIAEGEVRLLQAVAVARTLTGTAPQLLPEALNRLGGLYSDSHQPERGRAPLAEALSSPGGIAATEVARARDALGMIDLAAGNRSEAESHLRESVALATAQFGDDHPITAAYQIHLALALLANGNFDGAGLLLRRAQFVMESTPAPPGRQLGVVYAGMSAVANSDGKAAQAEDYARRAVSILDAAQPQDPGAASAARITLAAACLRTHDMAEAEKILPVAVDALRATGTSPGTLAAGLELLGKLRAQQQNWQAAESLYREALGIYTRDGSGSNSPVAPLLRALAEVLKKDGGSKAEVRALELRARDIDRSVRQGTPHA